MTEVSVAIPTSILQVESTLLLKTLRVHQVARTLSIFGVSTAVFYRDFETGEQEHEEYAELIRRQWSFFFTPPYLRRRLVPIHPLLRHVGMLPPIRLSWFDAPRELEPGDERVAFIAKSKRGFKAHVDSSRVFKAVGDCREGFSVVRVSSPESGVVECLDKEFYRGPRLVFKNSLKQVYEDSAGFKIIATSRYGRVPGVDDLFALGMHERVLIVFGSPRRGLHEMARAEGIGELGEVWNTVPGQLVKTVRTEEALIITLGLVNYALRLKGL
ncbi:MAG: putative RNA uridine N3 methyltransferase [Thermosphaera sp.]